ncbi:MAG: hypothetical protein EOO03_08630 [Chitinophagaceae bacterium]|nr:MAG: hypothetical protein EOO03_08630 [Chitinophagaceae bacterium]
MNKIIILVLLITGFWACNPGTEKAPDSAKEGGAYAERTTTTHTKNGLQLNNGSRWVADAPTNANVKNMQGIIENFDAGTDQSLAAHWAVSAQLHTALNKMISECRMKGANHDALHLWLEPLLNQVKQLKAASSENEASGIWQTIRTQVGYYNQYFE